MANERLATASKHCKAYRKYLKEKGIPPHLATKGFLLTRAMIDKLMTQDGRALDGIRIYVGLDETGDMTIKPYAVACVQEGEKYNDYKVPAAAQPGVMDTSMAATTTSSDTASTPTATSLSTTDGDPVLEEPRPCPSYCGTDNELNSGS